MENIAHLEQRVEKLEDSMKSLASLPDKFDMLIQLQRESNADTKELSKHITDSYVSKEFCSERHKSIESDNKDNKDFRKWVYVSLIVGAFTIILELAKYVGGK